jgi:hypothetical protein
MSGYRGLGSWVASGLCASVLLFNTAARADEPISEDAKLYFKNGVELIQSQPPNYQDAYYQFKLAYEKSHSWKVLGNYGLCAFKLERDGEAIQYYTDYLKGGGNDVDPDERAALRRDLLVLNGNSAGVSLSSAVAELDVTDSRAGSSAPPQSYHLEGGKLALRLRAGQHTLTATHDNVTQRWEIALSPGRNEAHEFDFTAKPAAVAPVPVAPAAPLAPVSQPPASTPQSGGTLRSAGFVTAGVGVAALVGGVVTGLMTKSKEADAKKLCIDTTCPESASSKFDSASSMATVTNILLIGGGALTAAGLGMIVFGGPKAEPEKTARVTLRMLPAVGRDGAALWAAGSF